MAQALDRRGAAPRTLFKIVLMLGLVLAGVAALAAEPETPADDGAGQAGCARSSFEFGGRTVENGMSTDTWVLTCYRSPAVEAAAPPAEPTAASPTAAAPVEAVPVATQQTPQSGTPSIGRF